MHSNPSHGIGDNGQLLPHARWDRKRILTSPWRPCKQRRLAGPGVRLERPQATASGSRHLEDPFEKSVKIKFLSSSITHLREEMQA